MTWLRPNVNYKMCFSDRYIADEEFSTKQKVFLELMSLRERMKHLQVYSPATLAIRTQLKMTWSYIFVEVLKLLYRGIRWNFHLDLTYSTSPVHLKMEQQNGTSLKP